MKELMGQFPRAGRVEWIGLRPGREESMIRVDQALLIADRGLQGDRAADRTGSKRQVSLIQGEHLPAIAALAGQGEIDPAWLRRNIVVSGINLRALQASRFRIGEALLEGTDDCAPCSKMETALGPGGYNAMRGHGGILARVLEGGPIEIGSAVNYVPGL